MSIEVNKKVTIEGVTVTLTPEQAYVLSYILGNAIGGTVTSSYKTAQEGGLFHLWDGLQGIEGLPHIPLRRKEGYGCHVVDFAE